MGEDGAGKTRRRWHLGLAGGLLAATGVALLALPDRSIGPLAVWPPMVALVIVFATRRASLGLLTASLAGILVLAMHPDHAALSGWLTGGVRAALIGPWHLGSLLFTLLLGSFAAVLEQGGGLRALLSATGTSPAASRRRFLTSVYGVGLLCFFDGLANSLMLGRVARPLADRLRISRAFLAYLVDTTSSAVACVAFLSTWIAIQLSLIAEGVADLPLDEPAYLLFLQSIPRNFYCLFALFLAYLATRRYWRIGPMRRSQPVAETGTPTTSIPSAPLWRALIPLALLLLVIPVLFYLLHHGEGISPRLPVTLDKIHQALGSNAGPPAFVIGSATALLTAALLFPPSRRRELPSAALRGAVQLLPALGVLVLAWILGSVLSALGTAGILADLLGDRLPVAFFPAGVFALGCLVSFVSGTSWGTMAILMPLVLPTLGKMAEAQGVPPELLAASVPAVISAVFGGAVFGDHCSPYSDTTIVSSLACGISTPEHTITQLPYALLTAAAALACGYFPLALGLSPWLALGIGALALTALVHTTAKTAS